MVDRVNDASCLNQAPQGAGDREDQEGVPEDQEDRQPQEEDLQGQEHQEDQQAEEVAKE